VAAVSLAKEMLPRRGPDGTRVPPKSAPSPPAERTPTMLRLRPPADPFGRLDRREMLRVGGLSLAGLSLPLLLERRARASAVKSFGQAKSCILLYLSGAPSQLDTFDPKPDAPEDIRGEFRTIPTSLTGVRFSELLPRAAKWMNRIALVHTLHHDH